MPIYEYHCRTCGHDTEFLEKITEEPKTICPDCGQTSLRRKISAAGFQLKGEGWYVTDYKPKKPDTDTKTDSGAKSDTTTVEKKTETSSNPAPTPSASTDTPPAK